MRTDTLTLACAMALLVGREAPAATDTHIRLLNHRILEAFEYASARSATFRDVVATVETSNVIVSVAEGSCQSSAIRGCLQLLQATAEARHVIIRIDPRQPMIAVVRQLAHELQHAAEIAVAARVTDATSLRRLYETIGFRGVAAVNVWESRAAQAVEAAVARETSTPVLPVDAAYFGVWTLDAAASMFENVPRLVSGTRWHRDQRHGLMSVVIETVAATGARRRSTCVYRLDGRNYLVSDVDGDRHRSIAAHAVDSYTACFTVRHENAIVGTGCRTLERNGETMMVESEGVDAEGAPWRAVERWERSRVTNRDGASPTPTATSSSPRARQ